MPFKRIKNAICKYKNNKRRRQGRKHRAKKALIDGVSNLLVDVLGKNKANIVVIIDEIDPDNYGLGGKTITQVRKGE